MRPSLFVLALLVLAGCYETEVTRSASPHPFWLDTPDTATNGQLAIYSVSEYRRPRAIFRFPDGGKSFEVARYFEVRQVLRDGSERPVGRLDLLPVRRGDFGNSLTGGGYDWPAPNRLRWWSRHGYEPAEVRTDTVELTIPDLDDVADTY